ncbi:MAG TPA: DUF3274 domain-containing protein, partial [Telluria sp.]|nr:DUF3274 domain-containing protein [Telluria sp.]
MGIYECVPYVVGEAKSCLLANRETHKKVEIKRKLPANVIVVHGVNDTGTSYKAVEEGICDGLTKRLDRTFTPGTYRIPDKSDVDKIEEDPDAVFFKRSTNKGTSSPVIPFYWGFRELSGRTKTFNGQFLDRHGNRLDKDLSKGGGPFGNATASLPDMWNRGCYVPADFVGDALRPLLTGPGRLYMVLAAQRLAALISMIRDYDEEDTVSIVAHSQGCLISLLAQAILMGMNLRVADTLILTHPPYSLVEDVSYLADGLEMIKGGEDQAMQPHYAKLDGRQTLHARLQTLANIVKGVSKNGGSGAMPEFASLSEQEHGGAVGSRWKATGDRDNRGKVYLYFSPEDMTVALENIRGIGWQGVPDHMTGNIVRDEQDKIFDRSKGTQRAAGPLRPVLARYECAPLSVLGPSFFQRVFTLKPRVDIHTGKVGPVLVGQPPHDFELRAKGEDDHDHVEASSRRFRENLESSDAAHGGTTNSSVGNRKGWRSITGEALGEPVCADLLGEYIGPRDIPKTSSHYGLKTADQGPCELVDPIDAAIATASRPLVLKVERPDPSGKPHYPATPQDITTELKKMTDDYNNEKHPGATKSEDLGRVLRAIRYPDGRVIADIQQSANETRRHWQREVSAKSFHGGIIGSSRNHAGVTSYDISIGSGNASSDPLFYRYLCAVADWRLTRSSMSGRPRPAILTWETFCRDFSGYWRSEPAWRGKLIAGNSTYYSTGELPQCVP